MAHRGFEAGAGDLHVAYRLAFDLFAVHLKRNWHFAYTGLTYIWIS